MSRLFNYERYEVFDLIGETDPALSIFGRVVRVDQQDQARIEHVTLGEYTGWSYLGWQVGKVVW